MSLCSDGLSSDQYFLLNFIMSNYLGPDVYSDNPRCSASQRLAKGLPPYTLNHIGSSSLTLAQLQCLYYHVLRNAHSSLLLHPNMLYMYLKGFLPLQPFGVFPQFTSFFPNNLHPQKMYSPSHEIFKGIVVIDDPAVAFISKEELHKFRCLARLNDLKIDRFMCLSPPCVESRGTEQDCSRNAEATSNGLDSHQDHNSSGELGETRKRKKEEEAVVDHTVCVISKSAERVLGDVLPEKVCFKNGEANSSGNVSDQDCILLPELQDTCNREEEEEAVVGHAVCVISKAAERDLEDVLPVKVCYKNGEANSCDVSDQDCIFLPELQDTCNRKKEEEAVAGHADCVISKATERDLGETLSENGFYKNREANSSGVVSDQDCDSSAELQEPCKRTKEEEEAITNLTEKGCCKSGEANSNKLDSDEDCNPSPELQDTCKRKNAEFVAVTDHADFGINKTPERFRETYQRKRFKSSSTKAANKNGETDQPTCTTLVPVPSDMSECDSEPQVIITGTASKGTVEPSVGVVDIGVNKVAYFFQVALPGVRKDYGEFSCEIESDGKVILEGWSTRGGKTVKRHSRVFKMNSGKLCPPGPFKLCFNLPGPVDPRLFSPNFRSDGIFEAVIIRHENSKETRGSFMLGTSRSK